MKNLISYILLILLFQQVHSQFSMHKWEDFRFQPGETLTYSIKYGPMHGGDAIVALRHNKVNDNQVYHASVLAKTVGLADKLFKIRDVYESYFDTLTCLPYKSIRNISEGNYKYYNEVYFDHPNKKVTSQISGEYEVPEDILDMVSGLYYIRCLDIRNIKEGDVLDLVTFFGDEIFPFAVRYAGIETIRVKMGKIKCYRFDPVVEVGRIFKSEDDMTFWLSADDNMIPVRVRMDMIVGAIRCNLDSYDNLKNELKLVD